MPEKARRTLFPCPAVNPVLYQGELFVGQGELRLVVRRQVGAFIGGQDGVEHALGGMAGQDARTPLEHGGRLADQGGVAGAGTQVQPTAFAVAAGAGAVEDVLLDGGEHPHVQPAGVDAEGVVGEGGAIQLIVGGHALADAVDGAHLEGGDFLGHAGHGDVHRAVVLRPGVQAVERGGEPHHATLFGKDEAVGVEAAVVTRSGQGEQRQQAGCC